MIPPCTKQGNLVAACESTVVCVLIEKLAALLGAASVGFCIWGENGAVSGWNK